MHEIDEALKSLLERGYIDVEYNEELEATFNITPKGEEYLKGVQKLISGETEEN